MWKVQVRGLDPARSGQSLAASIRGIDVPFQHFPCSTVAQMKRRAFVGSSLIIVSLPQIAAAQSSTSVFRVGWVVGTSATASAPLLSAFRKGLADLGYIEGRNLAIEARYADDVPERVAGIGRRSWSEFPLTSW